MIVGHFVRIGPCGTRLNSVRAECSGESVHPEAPGCGAVTALRGSVASRAMSRARTDFLVREFVQRWVGET